MYVYAVKSGLVPGVYRTWSEAQRQVNGFSGAELKKFSVHQLQQAYEFIGIPLSTTMKAKSVTSEPTSIGKNTPKFRYKPIIVKRQPQKRELSQREQLYFNHENYAAESKILHIYTDGSTIGNGKKNATGGYGVFFGSPDIPYISSDLNAAKVTNNVAELKGIIEAMKVIKKLHGYIEFIIHYDSDYASGVITGRKQAHTNLDLVQEGKQLLQELRQSNIVIKFEHVKAHTGSNDLHSIGNDIVDNLAKRHPL